jgi:hypothetical protein
MNRATSATGWVRNPVMKAPNLDPVKASSYELGWTSNPLTGCLNHVNGLCKGGGFPCYAYGLANGRLKGRYLANANVAPLELSIHPSKLMVRGEALNSQVLKETLDPFYPRFWEERLEDLPNIGLRVPWSRERGIFICDMGDLFGIGVPEEWTRRIMERIKCYQEHRFYLLTKQPQNLPKFSPFPDNCFVGVTAANARMFRNAIFSLGNIKASVKYISFEPLLASTNEPDGEGESSELDYNFSLNVVDWLIIGACTSQDHWELEAFNYHHGNTLKLARYGNKWTLQPKIRWVKEIVEAADKAGIPVFLKDNLGPLFDSDLDFGVICRQEMPKVA